MNIHNIEETRINDEKFGISCFLSQETVLLGDIKKRYSDFVVREINKNGQIAFLDNIEPPRVEEESLSLDNKIDKFRSMLSATISSTNLQSLINLIQISSSNVQNEEDVGRDDVIIEGLDKGKRSLIHQAIHKFFEDLLIASTIDTSSKLTKNMIIKRRANKQGAKNRSIPSSRDWNPSLPPYVQFVLEKFNLGFFKKEISFFIFIFPPIITDTNHAMSIICSKLRIKPNSIHYAGTKDKRGFMWISF